MLKEYPRYLYFESKKPPREEPQIEKAMATTPFHRPSSRAVIWWSIRKSGNMVMAPCSPGNNQKKEKSKPDNTNLDAPNQYCTFHPH